MARVGAANTRRRPSGLDGLCAIDTDITGILLDTPIRLKRFYQRRSLRRLPAFYAYLAVVFTLIGLEWQTAPAKAILFSLLAADIFYRGIERPILTWSDRVCPS